MPGLRSNTKKGIHDFTQICLARTAKSRTAKEAAGSITDHCVSLKSLARRELRRSYCWRTVAI